MATYGLLPSGFFAKPLQVIEAEIDAGLQQILGTTAGTESDNTIPPQSEAGQLKVLLVDTESAMWDLTQAVMTASDPNQATDSAQDALCAITGTVRSPQQFSTATVTCVGVAGTVLLLGRVLTVKVAGSRFDSDTDATLAVITTPAWANSTDYAAGFLLILGGNLYGCIAAGTSAAMGFGAGPTGTGSDILDGSVHWTYLGPSSVGVAQVVFTAEQPGPLSAGPGTLSQIATPVSGWSLAYNFNDAENGALIESNTALRYKRDQELAAEGNATTEAIRSKMLLLNQSSTDPNHPPVRQCTVFYNDADSTDGNGLPPHSVEVLVLYLDGSTDKATMDQDISDLVWETVGDGIAMFGNQTGTVVDSQGNDQTVYWSKPTPVPIYQILTAYYDASKWPDVGGAGAPLVQQAVISALLTYADMAYLIGLSVRVAPLSGAIFEGPSSVGVTTPAVADVPAPVGSPPIPGMLDVTPFYIGSAPSPSTSTPIAIGVRQIAIFSAANIAVTATAEAP